MVIDYKDNMSDKTQERLPISSILDMLKNSVSEMSKRGAFKSHRQNINLYMPLSIIGDFRKMYRRSLSKRDRVKYAPLPSKNIVVIGGYRLQIRTKCKGYDLELNGDIGDMYLCPV